MHASAKASRERQRPEAGGPRAWRQAVRRLLAAALPRRLFLVNGPAAGGAVCLTFDDGPHPVHTPRVLDVLRRHGVAATFFVVGREAERHPDLVRRIAAEGHAVGNHTYSHGEPGRVSAGALLEEVRRTDAVVRAAVGEAPRLFRPPHGKVTATKLWRLWRDGWTVVLWNADTKDYARRSAADLRGWVASRAFAPGDVVLMHDTCPHTALVLPDLIAAVRDRGLTFATPAAWAGRASGLESRL
jgi:peptidoglycan/xylan/chitin deacetylase (PgdA/CDA1 family)